MKLPPHGETQTSDASRSRGGQGVPRLDGLGGFDENADGDGDENDKNED